MKDTYLTTREFDLKFSQLQKSVEEIKNNHLKHLEKTEQTLFRLYLVIIFLAIMAGINVGVMTLKIFGLLA